jgi:hypothetical protein
MSAWILIVWISTGRAPAVPVAFEVRDEVACHQLADTIKQATVRDTKSFAGGNYADAWAHSCVRRP